MERHPGTTHTLGIRGTCSQLSNIKFNNIICIVDTFLNRTKFMIMNVGTNGMPNSILPRGTVIDIRLDDEGLYFDVLCST